ncbi:hypothetical protein EHI45_29190 [Rhizobium leguminosarum]|nr:hypothetical protein EHI45_29190 [Rhizobium leguminosarum]
MENEMSSRLPSGVVRHDRAETHAQGPWSDLALHTIGWKAFQDLCAQVAEETLRRPVQIFREAQDGGQDAVFTVVNSNGSSDATIQCKHSSDAGRRLKLSDLSDEIESVKALVLLGQATTYVLMTNMGVDAPTAAKIRQALRKAGVQKPHVLGKQYLVLAIRRSSRLRAMVPQVYGLGDLSAILDQRMVEQTRALLDQWIPKLNRYVPTEAHRKAVRALTEHGVVLLLGNPSSGKSTIGAILSTIATDEPNVTVLKLESPGEFSRTWQPHDKQRFFWIDDAFGSNVVRNDFVQDWTSAFVKMEAAIARGNRFLLTSRRHIYEAAKQGLGQRNLSHFRDGTAVVNVGALTPEERAQILYNHIAFGEQSSAWKASVKDELADVAAVDVFLPGVAERLGNPVFTKRLRPTKENLVDFMEKPREHLVETINDLDVALRAALMLIYVHQGTLPRGESSDNASIAVSAAMDTPLPRIQSSLSQLNGSFVQVVRSEGSEVWTFAHPTISDAVTVILESQPHMIEALVRGAPIEKILSDFVCEGAQVVTDAPEIPHSLDDVLVARLCNAKDDLRTNFAIFSFLNTRATDEVVRKTVNADPTFLSRETWRTHRLSGNPKLRVHARAHRLGILDAEQREWASDLMETAGREDFDLSFTDDEDMMAVISPTRLFEFGFRLGSDVPEKLIPKIKEAADDADEDDPENSFEHIAASIGSIENISSLSDRAHALLDDAREQMSEAIAALKRRKRERDEDHSDEWDFMSSEPKKLSEEPTKSATTKRSIFADVDQGHQLPLHGQNQ